MAPMLAQWADSTLFWTVIPYTMQPAGVAHVFKGVPPEVLKAFAADRAPFTATMRRQTLPDATAALSGYLADLEATLADGRPFFFGTAASIADFSIAHCLWYVRRGGSVADIVQPHFRLTAWTDRMLAMGHGNPEPLSSGDAVAIAASSTPAPTTVQAGLGFEAGQSVTIAATDYGIDPVAGTLVGLSQTEAVLRRTDERAGTVHVHFPRAGYQIK
jgi:hypothetical protein